MGLKEIIKKWSDNKKEKSSKFKEMMEEYRMQKLLEQRQKSSNERELERYMKEQREKIIKEQLQKIRKKETQDSWKGNVFSGKATILQEGKPILKEKNIFAQKQNRIPFVSRGMFFK